jgi:voltage-gated potassium channel
VTTVGYGEPGVTTDGGRVIAIGLMFTGIGFVAVLTASAAERFVRSRRAEERAREERRVIEERAQQQRRAIEERLDQILARLESLEGGR